MLARWKRYYDLYLLLLPTLLYFAIFEYGPIYGLQIAFKNFLPFKGILDSPWVGFDNFQRFIENYKFWEILLNTMTYAVQSISW
ncbi:hypothetical protein PALA111701_27675 [Paenibacillus lactis]